MRHTGRYWVFPGTRLLYCAAGAVSTIVRYNPRKACEKQAAVLQKSCKIGKILGISQRLYSLYKVTDDKMYAETAFYTNFTKPLRISAGEMPPKPAIIYNGIEK